MIFGKEIKTPFYDVNLSFGYGAGKFNATKDLIVPKNHTSLVHQSKFRDLK